MLLASLVQVSAQSQIHATAKIDTTVIRIGEQFHLNLTATVPVDAQLTFPAIGDTIHKLEVVQRSNIDTAKSQDGKLATYHQSITLDRHRIASEQWSQSFGIYRL